MYEFEPIAIVGLGSIAQDCFSYKDFWTAMQQGKILLSDLDKIEPDIYKDLLHEKSGVYINEKAWTLRGGFITHFEKFFNPDLFSEKIKQKLLLLDPLYQWSLMAAYESLKDVQNVTKKIKKNTGVIIGNTAMPSELFTEYASSVFFERMLNKTKSSNIDSFNRFIPGTVAKTVADALGLQGKTFAMDAACASGLYSIKLACDYLHNREADLMLAGSVNGVARPMMHVAFSILGALSHTGQSRPFNRNADGILPSEGAAFVALKRLEDAINDKDKIFGVIRGIGLSNSGREGNFLAPSKNGEATCIKRAYEQANIDPKDISYLECHATGTSIGDGVEIRALAEVFGAEHPLTISSLKANVGHMISNAGIASVVRTLGCLNAAYLPMTPNTEVLIEDLSNTAYKVLQKNETWHGRRIAGINSFGLGGCNAHMIIEYPENLKTQKKSRQKKASNEAKNIAIVGIGIKASFAENLQKFSDLIFNGTNNTSNQNSIDEILINPKSAFVPPIDLKHTQGQQLLLLPVLEEALSKVKTIDKENTGVYIGMETDPEGARYLINVKLNYFLQQAKVDVPQDVIDAIKKELSPPLDGSNMTGILSHLVSNRLSYMLDAHGPSMTTSAEELSGDAALKSAISALQKNEISTALVGAVDLSNELVHKVACNEITELTHRKASDAAIILVLKTVGQAITDSDSILATISEQTSNTQNIPAGNFFEEVGSNLGFPHSVVGLINIAATALAVNSNVTIKYSNGFVQDASHLCSPELILKIKNQNFLGESYEWFISHFKNEKLIPSLASSYSVFCFAADNKETLIKCISDNAMSLQGMYKLAFVCENSAYLQKKQQALNFLSKSSEATHWAHSDIIFNSGTNKGELAFVFTGSAAAYPGAIKDICQYFPTLISHIQNKGITLSQLPEFALNKVHRPLSAYEQTIITNILSQIHAAYLLDTLKITPSAAIGLSQGETEAFFAFDVWRYAEELAKDIKTVDLYGDSLSGKFKLANKYWKLPESRSVDWRNYFISGSVSEIKKLVAKIEKTYLLISYTDSQCVIGGEAAACQNLLNKLSNHSYIEVFYDLIFHCPIANLFSKNLYALYSRKTFTIPKVRFYSNHFGGKYSLDKKNIAEAIVGQATSSIDFPKVIEAAWKGGIRYFVELGPKSSLSSAINNILKDKEHIAIPLDMESQNSYKQMLYVAGYLWCLGIPLEIEKFMLKAEELRRIIETSKGILIKTRLPNVENLKTISTPINTQHNSKSRINEGQLVNSIMENIQTAHQDYLEVQRRMLENYHKLSAKIIEQIKK